MIKKIEMISKPDIPYMNRVYSREEIDNAINKYGEIGNGRMYLYLLPRRGYTTQDKSDFTLSFTDAVAEVLDIDVDNGYIEVDVFSEMESTIGHEIDNGNIKAGILYVCELESEKDAAYKRVTEMFIRGFQVLVAGKDFTKYYE